MSPRLARSPWWPLLAFALVMLAGGLLFNTVHAHGRIVADVTGQPVKDVRFVAYGTRQYAVDESGVFDIPDLPRGAKLTAIVPGYNRKEFDATDSEVRLVVGVVNFQVNDATTKVGIPSPEARVGDGFIQRVGKGSETGNMAVGPAPDKNTDVLICATDYTSQTVRVIQPIQIIELNKQAGTTCPPIPTSSPVPTVAPSGTPLPTASPSPKPSGP
jgi:hypothetical protein